MLHLHHAAEHGHTKAYLMTVDSDVVVLVINFFHELGLSELWIGFGSGKSYKNIPIQHIAQMLGPQHCIALPLFNALTGCDVVSAMFGIGKKTAWNAWLTYPQVTDTLIAINCGCVVACRGNWTCNRAGFRCSPLCKCEGGCTNNDSVT